MKRLAIALLFLAGCGTAPPQQVEDELKTFIPKFEQAAQKVGKTISVQRLTVSFADSLENYGIGTVGICLLAPQADPTIKIDKAYWSQATPEAKEVLMFHEMGHCVLGRDHFTLVDPFSGAPVSIMHPVLIKGAWYGKNQKYYTTELFWNESGGGTNPSVPKTHVCKNRLSVIQQTKEEIESVQPMYGIGSFFKPSFGNQ